MMILRAVPIYKQCSKDNDGGYMPLLCKRMAKSLKALLAMTLVSTSTEAGHEFSKNTKQSSVKLNQFYKFKPQTVW